MKKLIPVFLVVLIVVVALVVRFRAGREENLVFSTVVATPTTSVVKGIGIIQPRATWKVGVEQAGFFADVLVEPGTIVEQGDPLVQLRNEALSAEVRRHATAVEEKRLELKKLQNVQQAVRAERVQSVRKLELNVEAASMQLDATRTLFQQGIVSAHAFQLAEIDKSKVESELTLARQALASTDAIAATDLELSQSTLALAEGTLEQVRQEAARLTVVAPVGGQVQWLLEEYGTWVDQGEHVATIAASNAMIADLNVREHEANLIQQGAAVKIIAAGGETKARVSLVDPAVVDGAVRVKAELDDEPPAWVRPNTPIQAEISTSHLTEVLFVDAPRGVQPFSQSMVYRLANNGDELEVVSVTFGRRVATQVEIRAGLREGDIIVTSELPNSGMSTL